MSICLHAGRVADTQGDVTGTKFLSICWAVLLDRMSSQSAHSKVAACKQGLCRNCFNLKVANIVLGHLFTSTLTAKQKDAQDM